MHVNFRLAVGTLHHKRHFNYLLQALGQISCQNYYKIIRWDAGHPPIWHAKHLPFLGCSPILPPFSISCYVQCLTLFATYPYCPLPPRALRLLLTTLLCTSFHVLVSHAHSDIASPWKAWEVWKQGWTSAFSKPSTVQRFCDSTALLSHYPFPLCPCCLHPSWLHCTSTSICTTPHGQSTTVNSLSEQHMWWRSIAAKV